MGYYFRFDFSATLRKDLPNNIVMQIVNYIHNDTYFEQYCPEHLKEKYKPLLISTTDQYRLRIVDPVTWDPMEQHHFFTLDRWPSIFSRHSTCSYYPSFDKKWINIKDGTQSEYWVLNLSGDINYGLTNILWFIDWISPYVAGHKPKQYVGWYQGEDQREPINLYIKRK